MLPSSVSAAVLQKSEFHAEDRVVVRGPSYEEAMTLDTLAASMISTGFQATNVGLAIREINRMLSWRLSDVPVRPEEPPERADPAIRAQTKCTIFLSYTSNLISSGLRETIRFLVQHKMVRALTFHKVWVFEHQEFLASGTSISFPSLFFAGIG